MVSKEEAHPLQKFIPSIVTVSSTVASALSGKQILYRQILHVFAIEAADNEVIYTKMTL